MSRFHEEGEFIVLSVPKTPPLHFHEETERFSEKNMKLKRLQNRRGKNGQEINFRKYMYKRRKKGVGESIGEN
jgi:hypothetical protein